MFLTLNSSFQSNKEFKIVDRWGESFSEQDSHMNFTCPAMVASDTIHYARNYEK